MVAGKVNFTNSARDLEEFIAPSRILKELEGEEDWAYRYVEPVAGENARMRDEDTRARLLTERDALYEEYEQRTVEWIAEPDAARRQALAQDRNDVARRLDEQYWVLDPYIRARSLYDRIGVIKPGGAVDYDPTAEAPAAVNGTATTAAAAPTPADPSADDLD